MSVFNDLLLMPDIFFIPSYLGFYCNFKSISKSKRLATTGVRYIGQVFKNGIQVSK